MASDSIKARPDVSLSSGRCPPIRYAGFNMVEANDTLCESETAARRDAALKRMLATPPISRTQLVKENGKCRVSEIVFARFSALAWYLRQFRRRGDQSADR